MAANKAFWPSQRATYRKRLGIHEIDVISKKISTNISLEKKVIDHSTLKHSANEVQMKLLVCGIWGGAYNSEECHITLQVTTKDNYAQNYQLTITMHSGMHNPGWHNHPNFFRSNNKNNHQSLFLVTNSKRIELIWKISCINSYRRQTSTWQRLKELYEVIWHPLMG